MFFFFNDTATTEIYTLSLHDALPIYQEERRPPAQGRDVSGHGAGRGQGHGARGTRAPFLERAAARRLHRRLPARGDRKSTRLNSSHSQISYAVFCLKKKKRRKIIENS